MNPSELFRVALRALRAHKMRSFLTLLGVIIGVTTIVGVVGIISGLNTFVKTKLIAFSPDVYIVDRFGLIRGREEFLQAIKRPPLSWQEYQLLTSGVLQHADMIAARAVRQMAVNNGSKRLDNVVVVGATANFHKVLSLTTDNEGRFFTEGEDEAASNLVVIGANIKEELFPYQDPIGRTILLRGLPFTVIGHMPKEGRGIGIGRDQLAIIPMQVYRKNFMNPNDPFSFFVKAKGGVAGLEASLDETRAVLRARRHTAFRSPDPFGIMTQESLMELWRQISSATFILMGLVSSVSLGVGGIVIMNIMLVSVVERTQEIGIRLAIGAKKRDILRQFLLEAVLLSMAGGFIGVVLGWIATLMVQHLGGFPAQVTPIIVFSAIALSTVVGLLAGFLPAKRAANLPVIDAIRAE